MRPARGFTLLELAIVVGIVVMAALVVVPSIEGALGIQTREEVARIGGSLRALYGHAALTSSTCRMVFDLDEAKYWPECAQGKVRIKKVEESLRGRRVEDQVAEVFGRTPEEEEEKKRIAGMNQFMALGAGNAGELREGAGLQVWAEHQTELYTSGRAYVYFFPHGQAEKALIFVEDGDDDWTVTLNPMTGRTKVLPERLEVPR